MFRPFRLRGRRRAHHALPPAESNPTAGDSARRRGRPPAVDAWADYVEWWGLDEDRLEGVLRADDQKV